MNSRHLLLFTLVFNINLVAVLTKQRITVPLAAKLPEIQDRVITKYGCDHNCDHPEEESRAETAQILDLLEGIDEQGEKCEVWVESGVILDRSYDKCGVLDDLFREVSARKFKNIEIKNIEFRLIPGAAHKLLGRHLLAKVYRCLNEKQVCYLNEEFWVGKLKDLPIMSIFPPELQRVVIGDNSLMYEKRFKHAYDYFGKLSDAAIEEFRPTLRDFHETCQALIFISRARESFPCDLRKLTFQDLINEFNERVEIAWRQHEALPDDISKQIYKLTLEGFLRTLKNKEFRHNVDFEAVDKTRPILDISLELGQDLMGIRESLNKHVDEMFAKFVDLDLFCRAIMLEKKPEIKKILIFTGDGHTDDVANSLRMTGRYEGLMHEFNPKRYESLTYSIGGEGQIQVSTPLRIYLIDIAKSPRKNLEWEIWLKRWVYPIGWHIGLTK